MLLLHLLNWQYQPGRRTNSWLATILNERNCVAELIDDAPSLRPLVAQKLTDNYPVARLAASGETGLPETAFPPEYPYTIEQMLDRNWLP